MIFSLSSLLAVVNPPAGDNLSIFNPSSPPAAEIRDMFALILAITAGIFLAVEGILIYCIFRFRRRPGQDAEPPQIYGSKPIEIAWTVAPAMIVFVLFLVTVRVIGAVRKDQVPADALRVQVIGHQWWWEYRYPEQGIITANELVVPAGRAVYLELDSADVIHSFWVPRLAGKTDVIPGKPNRTWFQAEEARTYYGQCAEFCGNQHAGMLLLVHAVPAADFDAWVKAQQRPAETLAAGFEAFAAWAPAQQKSAEAGRKQFLIDMACVNCHTVQGTAARGTFGPDLTHLMSRQTLAAGLVPNDADNLYRWLKDPNSIKPGCNMPDMKLSDAQARQLTDYLLTLR